MMMSRSSSSSRNAGKERHTRRQSRHKGGTHAGRAGTRAAHTQAEQAQGRQQGGPTKKQRLQCVRHEHGTGGCGTFSLSVVEAGAVED
jgi:hypothetical protein